MVKEGLVVLLDAEVVEPVENALSFPNAVNPGEIVGRTGCPLGQSARVSLDPLLANEISFTQTVQADEGVVPRGDPRTGGPPHNAAE